MSARIKYGEARPSSRNGHCSDSRSRWRSPREADRSCSATRAEPSVASTALMNRFCLSAKCLISGGNSVSTRSRRPTGKPHTPGAVGGVDGAGDVLALPVEPGGEGVQLAEEIPDLIGPPVHDVVDLVLDHFEVRDAAAAQDHGDAGQRPLGGGVRRRILQRDGVAIFQRCGDGSGGAASSTC